MKYVYSIFLILFSVLSLKSQTLRTSTTSINTLIKTDSLWFTDNEYVNYVFGNLNMQEVTSNFLLERSLGYFDPVSYDGKNANDSLIKSFDEWRYLYTTFYYGALDTLAAYAPKHPKLVSQRLREIFAQHRIPIALINRSYHSIKPSALIQGLFTTDVDSTKLYDRPNRTSSPYEKHRLFAASGFTNGKSYSSSGDVTFEIAPIYLYSVDTAATALEIDFGDGKGYTNVSPGSLKTVYYSTSGSKTIKVRQGGLECVSLFDFEKLDVFYNEEPLNSGAQFRGVNSSGANATVFKGCGNVLDKPIIIVEGFNIDENPQASLILNRLNRSGLVTRLMNLGYDFVIVKFNNNTAGIPDNALALRTVIDQVNSEKVGSNKLNIVGLSMGGLITKYCLKDMEDNGLSHNVDNYFSYDAPHQGAYAPFGLQYLLESARFALKEVRENPKLTELFEKLESDAGKQLLIYNFKDFPGIERSAFVTSYLAKGYPLLCNKYGIANGRGDGIGLNYPNGGQMMDFYAKITKPILGKVLDHRQEFYTLNSSAQTTLTYLNNRGFAAWLGLQGLRRTTTRVTGQFELQPESVPGSLVDMHTEYGDALFASFRKQKAWTDLNFFERRSNTFVPTVSALDLNNQSVALGLPFQPRNPYYNVQANHASVLSTGITPFDDIIYAVNGSQEHLTVDARISDFIFSKIYGTTMPTGCGDMCSFTPQFNGLTTSCYSLGANNTISIPNMPSGVIINWNMPAGIVLVSGQGTNSINVASPGDGIYNGGYVTVTWPGCTSSNYNFVIAYGRPTIIQGPVPLCKTGTYTIPFLPADATVVWQVIGTGATISSSDNTHVQLSSAAQSPTTLKATITSATCGNSVLEIPDISAGDLPYNFVDTQLYTDSKFGGPYVLCSNTEDNGFFNAFSYELDQTPAYPLTMKVYFVTPSTGPQLVATYTTSSISGLYRLPDILPVGVYDYWVVMTGGPCELHSFENAEGGVQVFDCSLSSMISIYPNPTSTELKIGYEDLDNSGTTLKAKASKGQRDFSVRLLNRKGIVLREGKTELMKKEILLQVSDLPDDTYFLHIKEGTKTIAKQVIIQH